MQAFLDIFSASELQKYGFLGYNIQIKSFKQNKN